MKILKIEMENLNALKGYWSIDFTNPDYETYHNLFVICGHTGSGKTTILDAITLALFGRTPRQGPVNHSRNEIMTRHTGYCRSVVTYECKAGKFESEFYQQRARKNSNGALQSPECRIKNLLDGTENTFTATSSLEQETTNIIQLDYSQFSRSIMLAQGEFNSFIKGSERDRAAILSKLNGTEQYKEIGRRVCERAKKFRDKLAEIENELRGIELLSDEEVKSLKKELKNKTEDNNQIKEKLAQINIEIKWLEDLKKCKEDFEAAEKQRIEYEKQNKDFKADEEKLTRAEKAEKCKSEYISLKQTQESLEKKNSDLAKAKEEFNIFSERYKKAEQEYEAASQALEEAEKKLTDDRILWKEVREIDAELKHLGENLTQAKNKKTEAEEKFNQEEQTLKSYKEKIKKTEQEINSLESYLKENEKDKDLEQIIFKLQAEEKSIEKNIFDLKEKQESFEHNELVISNKTEQLKQFQKVYDELNDNLKKLVSSEFVAVSILLKNQLAEGKPCPVCGSINHPSCNNTDENKFDDKVQKVAVDVTELNKKIEEAETALRNAGGELENLKEKNAQLENDKKDISEEVKSQTENITKTLSPWNFSFLLDEDWNSNLPEIIKRLTEHSDAFKKNSEKKNQLENEQKILETKIEAVNLEELSSERDAAQKDFITIEKKYDEVLQKRKFLFGDKNPDDEEKQADKNIQTLKNNYSEKENEKNIIQLNKNTASTSIGNYTNEIEELKIQNDEKLKKFQAAILKNGLKSQEEFFECRLEDFEIENLKEKKSSLIRMDGETKNALETARSNLEKTEQENKTEKNSEALFDERNNLNILQSENSETIGRINNQLENNSTQKAKAEEIRKKYDTVRKKAELWQTMRDFIGNRATGEDFEVFVEALAFKQLLKIANNYVEAITGQYTLVQVEGKVDFRIHDKNFPDSKDDRPISNMSGGEQFIISLSLALGIAELASRNVRVDSLFLDEGFGTLSGKPLMEAVQALKSLQNSGKMLGIITHIDAVIKEFDLRIHAHKNPSGLSELTGPGVYPQINNSSDYS